MGSDEEQTRIELVIREQIKAADVVVEEKVEKLVESTVSETTNATTTVTTSIASGIKELIQITGISSISESSLTDEQKKLATQIYDKTKAAIQSFINDASLNNTVKITKTLGQVIKQLEGVQSANGADKKAVAIQLGRILIKEVMPDDKGEAEVLVMYDLVAEPTLEAMIEVSRVVNVAVQELATKCCPSLLDFFKRAKTANAVTK
jgi:hypothetical protein